ncbi:MAG: hypothetical protein CMK36_03495 [Porticoccaceae bacterium]|nr:hypothetical protein [Porticoccaceae bacterium]
MRNNKLFESLANKDFRLLWMSSVCASFGMQMRAIAQGWLVYDITQSPMALTWVMLSFIVPSAIFSLIGGVLTDRISKKNLIFYTQLLNSIATLILAYLTYIGEVTFWYFIFFGILNGAIGSVSMPASFSIVPEVVSRENLVNANALKVSTYNLSSILGPALAGTMIGIFSSGGVNSNESVGIVFLIIAGILFLATFLVSFLKYGGQPETAPAKSSMEDLREGIEFVRKKDFILGLLLLGLIPSSFGKSINFLLPAFNQDVISGGPEELGILTAGMGIGALVGSLVLAKLGNFRNKGRAMFVLVYCWSIAIAIFAVTSGLYVAIFFGAFAAFFGTFFGSLNMSMTQIVTPQHIRGRVMSLVMVMNIMNPLAVIPIGAIAEYSNIHTALLFTAVMLSISAFGLNRAFPNLKRVDETYITKKSSEI